MMNKETIAKLKGEGFLLQNDKKHFSLRIITDAGNLTSKQLEDVIYISNKYARGYVGFTSRLSVEIPWIKYEDIDELKKELEELKLRYGGTGKRIRPLVSCKGSICLHGNIDTQNVCKQLDDNYFPNETHAKCKIGIAGCANNCIKANLNDIGIMGVTVPNLDLDKCVGCGLCVSACRQKALTIEDKKVVFDDSKCVDCGNCVRACKLDAFTAKEKGAVLYIGGRFGRSHRFGTSLKKVFNENEIETIVKKILDYYKDNGQSGERICHMIDRIGENNVIDALIK